MIKKRSKTIDKVKKALSYTAIAEASKAGCVLVVLSKEAQNVRMELQDMVENISLQILCSHGKI